MRIKPTFIVLVLMVVGLFSFQSAIAQETTEDPPVDVSTETEAPPTEAPIVTEAPVEAPAATEETPVEAPAATEETPVEAPVATEETPVAPEDNVEVTEETSVETPAPETPIVEESTEEVVTETEETPVPEVTAVVEATEAVEEISVEATAEVTAEVVVEATVEVTTEVIVEATAEVTSEDTAEVDLENLTERLISYDPAATEESIQNMLTALNAVEYERLPRLGLMRIGVAPETPNTADGVRAASTGGNLAALNAAGFASIEENGLYSQAAAPNDPDYYLQWGNSIYDGGATYVEFAHDISSKLGSGVVVAVVDSGVDLQHPDLGGQLVTGYDFADDDNNPDDACNGHGTLVAGIVAAKTNNGLYVAGVAPKAKVMPVRVLDCGGWGSWWDIASGIVYAVDKGAEVINLSIVGSSSSATMRGAIQYAITQNVVVVAAAGNTGINEYIYPAAEEGVISVGSVDINGTIATSSTFNDRVTVAAPGEGIYGLLPLEFGGATVPAGASGTSFAAPYVSGVAALLISEKIAMDQASVTEALICGALDLGAGGYDIYYGYGLLQADWSMNWRYNSSSCKVTQPNDLIQNATVIKRLPFQTIQPIHTRSATASDGDPTICGYTPAQTLWYEYTPRKSGLHTISTLGSSYDTVLAIYRGSTGQFIQEACNDDFLGLLSLVGTNLTGRETYYIAVGTVGSPIDDGLLQLSVTENKFRYGRAIQEKDKSLTYTGSWTQASDSIANGRRYMHTTDDNATVSFTFHGATLIIHRLVGPTQGDMQVYIDGGYYTTIDNGAAVLDSEAYYLSLSSTDEFHEVVIKRASGGSAGGISFDAIEVVPVQPLRRLASNADDRDSNISYIGASWSAVSSPTAYKGTLMSTTASGDYARFRAVGTDIAIYRVVGAGQGTMTVYVDGMYYSNVSNNYIGSGIVPFLITGLDPVEHTIEVYNNASSTLQIDQITSATAKALRGGRTADNKDRNIFYSGSWVNISAAPASSTNYHATSDNAAFMTFQYTGNYVCLDFVNHPDGGDAFVYINENYVGTVNTYSAVTTYNNLWCTPMQASDATHTLILVPSLGAGQYIAFDGVTPEVYNILTIEDGLIQETHKSLGYFGPWSAISGVTGTQGNIYTTSMVGSSVEFWMQGSGFILYTTISPYVGQYEVYIDGAPWDDGTGTNVIDLYDPIDRDRGRAIGVDGLTPGLHHVELVVALDFGASWLDFDALRVFP